MIEVDKYYLYKDIFFNVGLFTENAFSTVKR